LQNSDAISTVTITDTDSGGLATAAAGGTYHLTPSAAVFTTGTATNYTITYDLGLLMVTRATLTVTADAQSRAYGAANLALTCTITGYANGENVTTAGVTAAPTCCGAAM
jgi:hypothetical protein